MISFNSKVDNTVYLNSENNFRNSYDKLPVDTDGVGIKNPSAWHCICGQKLRFLYRSISM